jgi:hypothetical protein
VITFYRLAAFFVLVGFWAVAHFTNDGKWLMRGGALLAAGAAACAVWEAMIDRQRHSSVNPVRPSSATVGFRDPVQRIAEIVGKRRLEVRGAAMSSRQFRLITLNASLAAIGEIVHGFGDKIFEIFNPIVLGLLLYSWQIGGLAWRFSGF